MLPIRQVQRDAVRQRSGHFLEGAHQRLLEIRAPILLQGFLRHQQGEQFPFGDLQGGKGTDLLRVKIAVTLSVVLQRQPEPVAHELDVAMNRFGANLQLERQRRCVRIIARLDSLMDPQHALQRRAGMERLLSFLSQVSPATRRWSCAFSEPRSASPSLRRDSDPPSCGATCG